eukprot:CAMPEP_0205809680 /NCGR_PEP_ID=MMETSP0205-20121125/13927_1 /ASSEMBLY_ACC=CAM_ASM_000278 /TAXON_ID=36767 /ORGANISM="Euplotes focardii, Strain TN1" /LENGTH=307 /DNA_ID=CAMNT_0053087187 /DNA_START=1 /DNA_END=921 /DNA_ORIENTATION=-
MISWLTRPNARLLISSSKMCFSTGFDKAEYLNNKRDYQNLIKFKNPAEGFPEYVAPDENIMPPNDEYTKMIVPKVNPVAFLKLYDIQYENYISPQSAYYAVKRNGIIWHIFDAKRIPLGRMAGRAATYLQGKYKPNYDPKKVLEIGDRIIVVNGEDIKVTGKKRYQKIFRHHTGYAGGLHSIVFKDLMLKDPQQLVMRVIRGMLPPNKTRKFLLERIKVYRGQYHPHKQMGMPHFMNQPLPDPHKILEMPKTLDEIKNGDFQVAFESDATSPHEAFKDLPRKINPMHTYPTAHYNLDFRKDVRNKKI